MRSIVVTGGAGFIGSSLVRHLLDGTDADVVVLDSLTYAGSRDHLAGLPEDRVRLVVGDVRDRALVSDVVAGSDVVVHCAAETHNDRSLRDPGVFVSTNVEGTLSVLEAVREHGARLHHVSTDEVFGSLALDEDRRFTEDSPYRPSSPYSASKAASDHLVRAWGRSFDVPFTISSCSNNYGPRQHPEKLIPQQVQRVLRGQRPAVYGDGLNVRDWIHVDDHSAAVLAVLERGSLGRTYLVSAGCERSNLEVVGAVLRVLGRPEDELDLVDDRPGHDRRYALDPTRTMDELGWRPRHVATDRGLAGLDEVIDWYRRRFDGRS